MTPRRIAIVACGALAREIRALLAMNGMGHVALKCLPATLLLTIFLNSARRSRLITPANSPA